MLNQYLVDYLKKHKNKFSFEILKEKLIKAGYPLEQIEEAKKIVYEGKEKIVISPPPISKPKESVSFWDFWYKKTYVSRGEKILDFIVGFIFEILLGIIMGILGELLEIDLLVLFLFSFILSLGLIVYFLTKRKYIAFGMISALLLPFLLFFLLFFLLVFCYNLLKGI